MLLNVLDGNGNSQKIISFGQEAVSDRSGSITVTAVAQVMMAANLLRSGFFIQNTGSSVIYLNDVGTATTGIGSFAILPNSSFPPHNYPVTTGTISILGTTGNIYTAREW